eukprot:COSAG02_NODE_11663_length_1677_cov_2.332700_1_plen_147_part_00
MLYLLRATSLPCKRRPLPNTNGGCRYTSPLTPYASSESSPSRSLSSLRLLLFSSSTQDPSLPVVCVNCLRSSLKALLGPIPCYPPHKHSHRQRHSHRSAHDCKFRKTVGGPGGELAGLHSGTTKHSNVSEELATAVPAALLIASNT